MIKTWNDYKEFLTCDYKSSEIFHYRLFDKIRDRRYKFYKSLRLTEYFVNTANNFFTKMVAKILATRHDYLCRKFQWTIPINVFDKGLAIVHVGTIVVSPYAKIGKNCRIHVCVNIGSAIAKGKQGAPIIGDNVYIAPGAKIFGGIIIGDNVAIGANAVVNKSFENGNCTIAGVPARKISNNTSDIYLVKY